MRNTKSTTLLFIAIGLIAAGCSQNESQPETGNASEQSEVSQADMLLLAAVPPEAVPVGQARQTAKPGETISITGQIGGTLNPIAEEYASFTIGDESILFCDEMGEDHCPTPWDACCEDPDKLAANRASIVFLDAEGQPLKLNLKQQASLSGLDKVTVTGTVAPSSNAGNLILHATGIYRHGS